MRVALIFDSARPETTGIYFCRAAKQLGLAAEHWWLRDADRIPGGYDLYLRVDHGDDYERPLPVHCRPAVFYAIDTHLPHSWRKIRRMARRFEALCCCHQRAAHALGAAWVPLACDPEWHRPLPGPRRWDIGFVGTEGGIPRKFVLQALREQYPISQIGSAPYERISEIYSQAKIGFNYSIADDVNMRAFEVMASGCLLVTNAIRDDDYAQLGLEAGRHFVAYRSLREMPGLVAYYLTHAEERDVIARRGCETVRQHHTYRERFKQLWAYLAAQGLVRALTVDGKDTQACTSS
jgi:hypothetical protein